MKAIIPVLMMALGLVCCGRAPEPQHPPEQMNPEAAKTLSTREEHKRYIEMTDPEIKDHLISDVSAPAPNASWLWTFDKPTLRVWTGGGDAVRHLVVKMAVVDATMKDTGPVTVQMFVNDHEVGKIRMPKAGTYEFKADVEAALVKAEDWAQISMKASPLWTAPADKKHLGFLLIAAGFQQ